MINGFSQQWPLQNRCMRTNPGEFFLPTLCRFYLLVGEDFFLPLVMTGKVFLVPPHRHDRQGGGERGDDRQGGGGGNDRNNSI